MPGGLARTTSTACRRAGHKPCRVLLPDDRPPRSGSHRGVSWPMVQRGTGSPRGFLQDSSLSVASWLTWAHFWHGARPLQRRFPAGGRWDYPALRRAWTEARDSSCSSGLTPRPELEVVRTRSLNTFTPDGAVFRYSDSSTRGFDPLYPVAPNTLWRTCCGCGGAHGCWALDKGDSPFFQPRRRTPTPDLL